VLVYWLWPYIDKRITEDNVTDIRSISSEQKLTGYTSPNQKRPTHIGMSVALPFAGGVPEGRGGLFLARVPYKKRQCKTTLPL
jgi:hypothetical protein